MVAEASASVRTTTIICASDSICWPAGWLAGVVDVLFKRPVTAAERAHERRFRAVLHRIPNAPFGRRRQSPQNTFKPEVDMDWIHPWIGLEWVG